MLNEVAEVVDQDQCRQSEQKPEGGYVVPVWHFIPACCWHPSSGVIQLVWARVAVVSHVL